MVHRGKSQSQGLSGSVSGMIRDRRMAQMGRHMVITDQVREVKVLHEIIGHSNISDCPKDSGEPGKVVLSAD